MSQRSMEMKVGGLIVGALVLLVGFVVLMGGLSLKPTIRVLVDFESPGGLQTGAPVRISGVRVGRVNAIEFQGDRLDDQQRPLPPIRVVAQIEANYQKAIHKDAHFFVTSQGVLGEMHLAIDPGSHTKPSVEDGDRFLGASPPRLDQLLGESYELLHRGYLGVVRNEKEISETFDGLHKTLVGTGQMVERHEEEIGRIVARLDSIATRLDDTLASAQEQYVDGPRINRILARVDHSSRVLDQNLEPMLKDTHQLIQNGNRLLAFLARDEQLASYARLTKKSETLMNEAVGAAQNANALSADLRGGKGTAGKLLTDDAIYDDLKELMRDIKHNPWKLMWKP